jgi:hypothetical protein
MVMLKERKNHRMSKEIATAIMEGKEVDHMKMETGG